MVVGDEREFSQAGPLTAHYLSALRIIRRNHSRVMFGMSFRSRRLARVFVATRRSLVRFVRRVRLVRCVLFVSGAALAVRCMAGRRELDTVVLHPFEDRAA